MRTITCHFSPSLVKRVVTPTDIVISTSNVPQWLGSKNISFTCMHHEACHKLQVPGLSRFDEGSEPEILSRIAQTTAALTRLKPVWNDRSISLSSKI